ncbi:hypothetical protein LEN26_012044 [Aphanomyces euteiches]|nr:hypothetical protein LEN26_012044 [Aphanomyces euteiches]
MVAGGGASKFFQLPPLSVEMATEFKVLARKTAESLIQRSQTVVEGAAAWAFVSEDSGLRVFKNLEEDAATINSKMYCGVIQVEGSIDDVAGLLQPDGAKKSPFHKDILDTSTLYTLEAPTVTAPNDSISIQWMAVKSPMKSVMMHRDVCFVQCTREFTMNGRRGWVRAGRSVKLDGCPNLEQTYGLVRVVNYGSGHVILESQDMPGCLDIVYVVHFDLGDGKSEWAVNAFQGRDFFVEKGINRRFQSLVELNHHLKELRTSAAAAESATMTKSIPRSSKRARCCVCAKRLGVLNRKIQCSRCAEMMCKHCDQQWRSRTKAATTVCLTCAMSDSPRSMVDQWMASYHSRHKPSASSSEGRSSDSQDDDTSSTASMPQYRPCLVYKCQSDRGFVLERPEKTQVCFN